MPDTRFHAPKTNEYQWRNLYLRKHGVCTYAPPMPKHPETATDDAQQSTQSVRYDGDARSAAANNDAGTSEDDDTFDRTSRRRSLGRVMSGATSRAGSRRPSLDVRRRSSGYDYLEMLTDQQLFSGDIFNFLSQNGSGASTPLYPRSQQQNTRMSMTLPSILRSSMQSNMDIGSGMATERSGMGFESPKQDQEQQQQQKQPSSSAVPKELLRLQRETWHLLMDNRIMLWFEREAKERGRIAASVQRRLLEVVTWTPDKQGKVVFKSPQDAVSKGAPNEGGSGLPPISAAEEVNENAELMQTLEKFAPFFAVISPPEALQRLVGHTIVARQRGRRQGAPEIIGFPLFSQYATWRETYENRTAWILAPFSFFLIHDCSYSHAHIAALYVLLGLINETAHTHTAECSMSEHQRQITADLRQRRNRGAKESTAELVLCPLTVMRQLTEDLLLAYEQSTARTTLSMALHVQDFLTDIVLDPDTASRFLSPDALRRQCGNERSSTKTAADAPAADPGNSETGDEAGEDNNSGGGDSTGDAGAAKSEQPERNEDGNSAMPREDSDTMDWGSLKQLNDDTFEELFVLAQWFVDAPTANSGIPVDFKSSSRPSSRSKKSLLFMGSHTVTSLGQESKKGVGSPVPSEASMAPSGDAVSFLGRAQEHEATTSIVEAIVRYEVQRQHLVELRHQAEQMQRSPPLSNHKKHRKKRQVVTRAAPRSEPASMSDLPSGATLLTGPLTFLTTYIRLHGASWLKELLGRLFNILRRESVLLYVNGSDMELPPHASPRASVSQLSASGEPSTDATTSFGRELGRWRHLGEKEAAYYHRLERLEDLICQDIQYVMEEFFSALHGKRSMTRLPQGISVLLTNFCTTLHLHLLRQHATLDTASDKPAIRVRKCLALMRQKRVTGGVATSSWGQRQQDSTDRLIRNIESHRLSKFVLFDCWILPTLNNAVSFGYLPESTSNHLLWNVDAFARYLKIIVNASSVPSDIADLYIHTTTPPVSAALQRGPTLSGERRSRFHGEGATAPRCNTVKLPPVINGVFDVSNGSLMQLFREPEGEDDSHERFVFGDSPSLSGTLRGKGGDTSCSSNEGRKPWCDISGALSALNESLGITGGDPGEETYEDDTDVTPVRILNIFCARASGDISAKVIVSEYEVAPTTAASCISKAYSLMSGQHPIVRNACLSGYLVGQFKSSPYLTCLVGVLLHPRTAAMVVENVFQNSRAFYNSLMKPLKDETMLSLMTSLVVARKHMPLVDSNELLSLVASIPMSNGENEADHAGYTGNGDHKKNSQMASWGTTTRRLLRQRAQATTGSALSQDMNLHPLLRRCGPTNPYDTLLKTANLIQGEMERVPLCFDTWWRAMVVALTVKAMNVIEECSDSKSSQWEQWCQTKMHEMQREYRGLCSYFAQHKGGRLDISKAKALACVGDRRRRSSSMVMPPRSASGSPRSTDRGRRRKSVRPRSRPQSRARPNQRAAKNAK
ncbi:hypothetical protein DQ04_01391060 [Trypanosoma grayi]|uniref:hypothetical protein n=1 Tax=Trypanosoma grayi TaxID=71804 RepID=UPI0004F44E40|nr:hypothetical protein DQ04_01391060 [Trypanosoma grayi]KEG12838.1 hypothetical protein DQ04_01391060 [Trypanosoma grayi]